MASRGIEIPLTLNPAKLIRGLKLTEREFEQLEDTLKDVEQAGDRMADDLEDSFKQAARAAERAGRDMTDGLDRGINRTALGVVGAEVADEFVESWGEAIRAGNPAEAIYEVLTNAGQIMAAALPGLGTVVGMGIATVTGIVQGIREEEKRIQEAIAGAISSAGDEAVEEQGYTTGKKYIEGVNRALSEEATERATLTERYGTDTFIEALEKMTAEAQNFGVESDRMYDIYTGTTRETQTAVGLLQQQRSEIQGQIDDLEARNDKNIDGLGQYDQQIAALKNQRGEIDGLIAVGEDRVGQIERESGAMDTLYTDTYEVSQQAQVWADRLSAAAGQAERTQTAIARIGDKEVTIKVNADVFNAEAKVQGVLNKLAVLDQRLAE